MLELTQCTKWQYNQLMTLSHDIKLKTQIDSSIEYSYFAGEELIYKGCRVHKGVRYRLLQSVTTQIDFLLKDNGYAQDHFRR